MSELNPPEDWQLAQPCELCGAGAAEPCAPECPGNETTEAEDLNDSNDWESTP